MAEQTKDLLHILRSEPDCGTQKLMTELSTEGSTNVIKLYGTGINWQEVVDAIFSHSRVVCWW
ncbi:MAG: hypothetical protein PVJ84_14675 [Desulfobacteraceae bacterium]|jgi:hypothetical protein